MSSFNGGDSQTFKVYAIIAQQQASRSELVDDVGENKLHMTQIVNLQPSTEYIFYVVAKNKHGNSSSEKMICKTLGGKYFGKKYYKLMYSAFYVNWYNFINISQTGGFVSKQCLI